MSWKQELQLLDVLHRGDGAISDRARVAARRIMRLEWGEDLVLVSVISDLLAAQTEPGGFDEVWRLFCEMADVHHVRVVA